MLGNSEKVQVQGRAWPKRASAVTLKNFIFDEIGGTIGNACARR